DEGSRLSSGGAPPTLVHGPLTLMNVQVDGRDQTSEDSIVEFDLASVSTLPHGALVSSAVLSLSLAGAKTVVSPASVSVNGYADGAGLVGLGAFPKTTALLGSTGNLPPAPPGSETVPFDVDITGFIQSIANNGARFVGFHLEGPGGDSEAWLWGSAAPDSAL